MQHYRQQQQQRREPVAVPNTATQSCGDRVRVQWFMSLQSRTAFISTTHANALPCMLDVLTQWHLIVQSLNYKFFSVWNLPNGTAVKWGRPGFPSGSGFKRNQTPDQQLLPHSNKPLRHVVAQLHAVVYGFCASSGMYSRNVSVRWVHVCFTKLGLSRLLSFVYHSDNSYIFVCVFFFFFQ